ncbi:hypothetical protein AWN90_07460 [Nocardia terpenica]|uniref:Uncharacterized protein n=1 Tax=Nocardia terpenica TaxID=455432 RepID=A0A164INS2_9NOCA|nr:hypothetical protein AWN90_07460 [Nocardia terpenica]
MPFGGTPFDGDRFRCREALRLTDLLLSYFEYRRSHFVRRLANLPQFLAELTCRIARLEDLQLAFQYRLPKRRQLPFAGRLALHELLTLALTQEVELLLARNLVFVPLHQLSFLLDKPRYVALQGPDPVSIYSACLVTLWFTNRQVRELGGGGTLGSTGRRLFRFVDLRAFEFVDRSVFWLPDVGPLGSTTRGMHGLLVLS